MTPDLKAMALRGALAGAALLLPPLHLGDEFPWRYAAALAQAPEAAEKQAFDAAKELGTVEAWDAFLSNYPTGFHADLARAYVKKLAGAATPAAASSQAGAASQPARELPCKDVAKLKSERSTEPAKIRFINESQATLVIQWIDFKGALKEYGELTPGAEMTQDTFITHPWIAAYQEGSCRQLFLPGEGVSIARLLPENQVRDAPKREASRDDKAGDHGPTPEQTCKDIGEDYNGRECVPRKSAKTTKATKTTKTAKPSKATVERRARAACVDIGMIYRDGKCAPKTTAERDRAAKNKNKACPAGMYRNPYGQCQPNETGG